jgi:hypothetical protein
MLDKYNSYELSKSSSQVLKKQSKKKKKFEIYNLMQQGSRLLLKYAKKKKFQLVQPSG